MFDIEYYISSIERILNERRFRHSIRVAQEAVKLAKKHSVNELDAEVAGVLHDYAKNLSFNETKKCIEDKAITTDSIMNALPQLAHGLVGAQLVKEKFNITDENILNSIRYHTTGRINMSDLEKIIYLADYIEPKRKFPGLDRVRKMAYCDLDKAMLMALNNTIKYLVDTNAIIHPDSLAARNYFLELSK